MPRLQVSTVSSGSIDEFGADVSGGEVAWAQSNRRIVVDYLAVAGMPQRES